MRTKFAPRLAVAAFALLALAGCANEGPKQTGGALLGGIGGAVVGSQFGSGTGQLVGTAVGTLLGAYMGSEVGKSLDQADHMYAQQASTRAFSTGRPQSWQNSQSGNSGVIQPQSAYQGPNGQTCRDYTQTVTIGGKKETAYGRACRQSDGSWQIVS